jgi:2,3-bisphosphoglycerate-independent phosphoglycerate mutase
MTTRPFVLIICDGWGERSDTSGNAIATAGTPQFDKLRRSWPHTTVQASGEAVGLPDGQMGNSEIGHLTIGAGRIIRQGLGRQLHELNTGSFYENEALITAIELAKSRGTDLHLMGLLSPGGIHSHSDAAVAIAKLAHQLGLDRVHVHAFTDGRDTPPQSGREHLAQFERDLAKAGAGQVRSVAGRYFAMDRDNRWDRTQQAYQMLVHADHPTHHSATDYMDRRYEAGEHDEFMTPVSIAAGPADRIRLEDGDVVIFFNFRPDRARQLTHALVDADFSDFQRERVVRDLHVVTFSEYDRNLSTPVAFPSPDTTETLTEVVSRAGLRQYHIAETEKYAHVTYFLNGGREEPFAGEDRELVPSPKVAYYDEAPAMSAEALTDRLLQRLAGGQDDLLVINYANADMVGHTGNFEATQEAIRVLDDCLGRVFAATLERGGSVLMTADHGNAEVELDAITKQPVTSHTTSPVPVILAGTDKHKLRSGGGLSDIAPTILAVMDLPVPKAMSGTSLIAS